MKILIAGSSGFVGSALVLFLREHGHEVVCLVRQERTGCAYWNPEAKQIDPSLFEGIDCVINLCGESILGRWNQKKMEQIRESRFQTTQFLCETLLKLAHPPKIYIGASAVGFYGDRGEERLEETSSSGHGYLAEVCRLWENFTTTLIQKNIRVCLARFGLVLGKDGGALKKMVPPFQMGMGGVLGNGAQFVSWVALEDVVRAILFMIETPGLIGPINVVSPNPVTNKEMTMLLGKVLKRPTKMALPKFMLTTLFGSGAEVFLASLNVFPKKLLESGFTYDFPKLEQTLENALLNKK